jgi:predicted lipoprotein with Yx(FWY)xxD motif
MRGKWWAPAGFAAAALVLAACGSSSSGSSGSASSAAPAAPASSAAAAGTTLKITTFSGKKVLTNAQGMAVYWFAPDTSSKSVCTGSCVKFWPPVPGPAAAGTGVTGTLGTITRADGTKQATYDGHPLYTYVADTAPGQVKGNALNVSGGLWWVMTTSGAKVAAASSSSSTGTGTGTGTGSSGGSAGYGY